MSEVTRIISAIERGDPHAAEQLLPVVYDELRKLAAQKLGREKPGQTLDATGLVHEAYLRLVGSASAQGWNSRGHFFAAAAEAMRRILIDNARRKRSEKLGGGRKRLDFASVEPVRMTSSNWMTPSLVWQAKTFRRPTLQSCACSPGFLSTKQRKC